MASQRLSPPPARNYYDEMLTDERRNVALWPRHSRDVLDRMQAGAPVITYGFRVGRIDLRCCWLHQDGTVTQAAREDWPL